MLTQVGIKKKNSRSINEMTVQAKATLDPKSPYIDSASSPCSFQKQTLSPSLFTCLDDDELWTYVLVGALFSKGRG